MAFIRVKQRGGRRYAYLVESQWQQGVVGPRQRVLAYLGREEQVRPEDVPEAYRGHEAVLGWFERRRSVGAPSGELRLRLRAALGAGDRHETARLARQAIEAEGPWEFVERTLVPLMHEVGDAWHAGRISVAEEHAVTRGVGDLLRGIRDEHGTLRRRRGGTLTVLLANPEGEQHALALDVLEARLAAAGHRTLVLPGGTPRRDLAARAGDLAPDLVLLSATMPETTAEAVEAAHAILERCPDAFVLLGGQAWGEAPPPKTLHPRVRLARPRERLDLLRLVEAARGPPGPA